MSCDVLVIGGGHNGLVCACYLAQAGLRVRVLERLSVVGGAAVTEEFFPGFRNSVASYTVSLLHPMVIRDLRLIERGLRIVERPYANFLPLPNGKSLRMGGGLSTTQREVAQFSQRDAERLPDYYAMLERVASVLRPLLLETPPSGFCVRDMLSLAKSGYRWSQLDWSVRRDTLDFFTKSAGQLLDSWFESDPIKAVLGFDAIVGHFASPYTPGSAYVLLHHCFGEVNGKKGQWGHAIGGMGAITQAMAQQAESLGVRINTDTEVSRILIHNKKAIGVVTADGHEITAKAVVSNLTPTLTFLSLVDEASLSKEFIHRIQQWHCVSGTFRMNVALSELPDFQSAPGISTQAHHQAGIILGTSLSSFEQAYFDARTTGWSYKPIIELLIPSTVDDSLAPTGKHVASLFCQHFHPTLPNGQNWDSLKETVADHIIETVCHYAPNFKASVIGRQVLSPLDLERRFGLTGGDIFHGALTLDQLYSARPVLGYGNYHTPIEGLYLCGSGTHPGGGVTGIPGHNAAREILRHF